MPWYAFVVSPLLFPSLFYLLPFGLLTLPFSPFMFLLCPPHGRNLGVTDPTFNHLFLIPDFPVGMGGGRPRCSPNITYSTKCGWKSVSLPFILYLFN